MFDPSPEFQKNLEEQVIAELRKTQFNPVARKRSIPLTLVATLAVFLLSVVIIVLATQSSDRKATPAYVGAQATALLTEETQVSAMVWSGNTLAVAAAPGMWLFEADNLAAAPARIVTSSPTTALAFKPDGSRIASAYANGDIEVWDVETDEILVGTHNFDFSVNIITYSPDGLWLAWSNVEANNVRVFSLMDGTLWSPLLSSVWPIESISFSEDSEFLSVVSGPMTKVWNVKAGQQMAAFRAPMNFFALSEVLENVPISISTEEWLAVSTSDGRTMLYEAASNTVTVLLEGGPVIVQMAFNSAGDQLAVVDETNTLLIFDVVTGERQAVLDLNLVFAS